MSGRLLISQSYFPSSWVLANEYFSTTKVALKSHLKPRVTTPGHVLRNEIPIELFQQLVLLNSKLGGGQLDLLKLRKKAAGPGLQ
jgi:hypothetical protein